MQNVNENRFVSFATSGTHVNNNDYKSIGSKLGKWNLCRVNEEKRRRCGLKRADVAGQSEKYFRHKTSSWRSCSIPSESFLVIRVYESYQIVEKLVSPTTQRILHLGCKRDLEKRAYSSESELGSSWKRQWLTCRNRSVWVFPSYKIRSTWARTFWSASANILLHMATILLQQLHKSISHDFSSIIHKLGNFQDSWHPNNSLT